MCIITLQRNASHPRISTLLPTSLTFFIRTPPPADSLSSSPISVPGVKAKFIVYCKGPYSILLAYICRQIARSQCHHHGIFLYPLPTQRFTSGRKYIHSHPPHPFSTTVSQPLSFSIRRYATFAFLSYCIYVQQL